MALYLRIDRGDIRQANRPLQQYLGFTAKLVMVSSSKADSLIAKRQRKERSERLMYEQSHRDYLRSGYLHHRLPVMGWLIITVITPLPTKPKGQKCQRTEAGERGNY